MGHLDHAAFGWLTPVLSYAMACVGAALGLRCTVRAMGATGAARRNWLLTAASALGTGIWTMHFVAMLGFGVTGTDIRYDVPLTVLSLLVAMAVVGLGLLAVAQGPDPRARSLLVGGLTTGIGVASMHYIGMAALRLHGTVRYDPLLVAMSVVIAVAAATAALWAALNIRSPAAVAIASPVMGAAVSSMHYTGMYAVTVDVAPSAQPLPGATATQFVFPLAVGLGSYLFLTAAFVALSPAARGQARYERTRHGPVRYPAPDHPGDAGPAPAGPAPAGAAARTVPRVGPRPQRP
ncbi:MHYT domain-containing protein [Streptomyces sp. enrichment culture]|uniref:MHYT domain-containing protein n=1 Tax=Streptomyces sp. enrichment culture TaxID=1795815 RepID=UPI003F551CF7